MNATTELLKQHRSIRKFTDQALSQDIIEELVRCGQAAATSSNVQGVSVINVTDTEKREALAAYAGGQLYVVTAGAFLVYCADLNRQKQACENQQGEFAIGMTEHFMIATIDVALAAQNTVIAAESMGLGICYIGGLRNMPAEVSQLLSIPAHAYPVFGLCIGYPDQDPEVKPRLPLNAVLMENEYKPEQAEPLVAEYDEQIREYYKTRTAGNKDSSWSEEMKALVGKESRPHMLGFLHDHKLLKK
ncbi:MAG: oxygen-insensitive NADPH nitroreductase [Granulosicoccaceae bacterium]